MLALAMRMIARMGVYRFQDLRVWQRAKRQSERIGQLLKRPQFQRDQRLSDQLNGAGISVMNNISEGFVRRIDGELLQFLRYAAASNAEVLSCYHAAQDRGYINKGESEELFDNNDAIGKMLRRFQDSVRNGKPPGRDE